MKKTYPEEKYEDIEDDLQKVFPTHVPLPPSL